MKRSRRDEVMGKTSANEILLFLKQNTGLLNRSFGVTRIGIFGSFAKGEQTASSDIDVVVEMEQSRKNIHSFLKLKRFLEKEMKRKIDLGFEHSLKPAIKEKVIKQIIYA
ncbi:MAG: nucleotidyltransferase domain-containing protein [Nitrospirae bacterium]|nr:nucleotidyltransferase domain-containing protein [Nitrospirota bacterium]